MKKKTVDPIITKSILETTLDERFEKFGREVDEKAREYRDEVLSKMDTVISELEQIRENQVFMQHDIRDHEQRITKLENA